MPVPSASGVYHLYGWPHCLAPNLFYLDVSCKLFIISYSLIQAINIKWYSLRFHASSCLRYDWESLRPHILHVCVDDCAQVSVRHSDALSWCTGNFSLPCTTWVPPLQVSPLLLAVSPEHREINIEWLAAMFLFSTLVMVPQGLCQS